MSKMVADYSEEMHELDIWRLQIRRCIFGCKSSNRLKMQRKLFKIEKAQRNMELRREEYNKKINK